MSTFITLRDPQLLNILYKPTTLKNPVQDWDCTTLKITEDCKTATKVCNLAKTAVISYTIARGHM